MLGGRAMSDRQTTFIRQQGFADPTPEMRAPQHAALLVQPRILAVLVLGATLGDAWWAFFALAAVLGWSALVPRLNPFDALYNRWLSARSGVRLGPAPAPRRFAQGLAALVSLSIGSASLLGQPGAARALEALLLVAIGLVLFAGFCLGAFVFHQLARVSGASGSRARRARARSR